MSGETGLWIGFAVVVLLMMAVDLGVFNRKAREIGLKEALLWTIIWTIAALLFNGAVILYDGPVRGLEFFTGYVIERALSFDNLFVFVLIFSYFGVPKRFHHRVLFWGIVGALVTRAIFILAGVALISRFEWVLYLFGVVLIYSGWKMLREESVEVHPEKNLIIRAAKKLFPVSTDVNTGKFLLRKNHVVYLTPLLLVLITIETTDIVFAVDSIPAVFGVTRDPFIAFTSNIFAILGLRASYFLLAGILKTFKYLSHGLSVVLMFIGLKMVLADFLHIPVGISLAVVSGVLLISVLASLVYRKRAHVPANKRPEP
jgi:tellurite resistance protein TerC